MNANHILTRSVPSPNDLQFLEDRLYEFNSDQTGQDDGQLFGFFIRNELDEIVAGCCGWTLGTCLSDSIALGSLLMARTWLWAHLAGIRRKRSPRTQLQSDIDRQLQFPGPCVLSKMRV